MLMSSRISHTCPGAGVSVFRVVVVAISVSCLVTKKYIFFQSSLLLPRLSTQNGCTKQG